MFPSRPRVRSCVARLALAAIFLATPATRAADYRIDTVAGGLAHPWSLAFLPDGRALVTERPGRLRVLAPDGRGGFLLDPTPVAGVPAVLSQGQAGLFDVLVDPAFAGNGVIYLSHAQGTPAANHLRVVRARLVGNRLLDVTEIFRSRPAKKEGQHFGGRMALLADGTLVIGMGDGNLERTDAQRLNTHLGKLLRINRDGSVPPDNPFIGQPGALPEIYSRGHRHPQGLVFVPAMGALFEHEHGARGGDELNRIAAGANHGWPLTTDGIDYTFARITPFRTLPGITEPLLHWTPSIAPAGMSYYDGSLFPVWRGSLFVAALKERSVRRVPMTNGVAGPQQVLFTELGERLRDVRSGLDGALYLLTDNENGRVLRVRPR